MAKRSNPKRNFVEVARNIVEHAIGEQMDGHPLPEPERDIRNPHAVALGSMGGRKGGRSRAKNLLPAKRKAIAKKGAVDRWNRNLPFFSLICGRILVSFSIPSKGAPNEFSASES
jgi:hypothetical protein